MRKGSTMVSYCNLPGQTMSHQGFVIPYDTDPAALCSLFLFRGWVLDTQVKLAFASIGTFLIGLLVELLVRVRREKVIKSDLAPLAKRAASSAIYLVQVVGAYFVMLLAMTMQVYLFFAAVFGLAVGQTLFNADVDDAMTHCFGCEACEVDSVSTE